MPARHAAACGGIVGLLLGVIVALVYDMQVTDAAFRLLILTLGGAWMGSILAGINGLLMPAKEDQQP